MQGVTEIRWHGRGGQGAKTAALLFADVAMGEGKYVQGFPEYGPERMGAPVQSFNRLSDEPITMHCAITSPSIVVVLDPTLIGKINVLEGLPKDGKLIVNTSKPPSLLRSDLKLKEYKLYTVDASKISKETIGREIPNTPMLGALTKASKLLDFNRMIKDMEKKLMEKFVSKPEVVKGNLEAIKRAYEEVKEE